MLSPSIPVGKVIEELQQAGYVAEGEVELTLTPQGQEARTKVKFKPREGFLSKLLASLKPIININNNFGG